MPYKRSPNCPSLSLPDAIARLERIYAAEGRSSFDGEIAVRHMYYKGLNGASRRALGAVRAFGLVEGRGNRLRVTDDAVIIVVDALATDQRERQQALIRALRFNRVFEDLHDRFGKTASELNIASYLQKTYGFKARSARKTARCYRDSVLMTEAGNGIIGANRDGPDLTNDPEMPDGQSMGEISGQSGFTRDKGARGVQNHIAPPVQDTTGIGLNSLQPAYRQLSSAGRTPLQSNFSYQGSSYVRDSFALAEGDAVLNWPRKMSGQSFEDFTQWLVLMHRKIGRDVTDGTDLLLESRLRIAED